MHLAKRVNGVITLAALAVGMVQVAPETAHAGGSRADENGVTQWVEDTAVDGIEDWAWDTIETGTGTHDFISWVDWQSGEQEAQYRISANDSDNPQGFSMNFTVWCSDDPTRSMTKSGVGDVGMGGHEFADEQFDYDLVTSCFRGNTQSVVVSVAMTNRFAFLALSE